MPEGHETTDHRAVAVFFHGGGWNTGNPEQFHPQCAYLASRGMVAISAEYRVSSRHGTSPRESVMDGNSAIRWIRKNARELGVDPNRIAAGGGSAGGQVAAATATTEGFDEDDENLEINSRPNALILFNPVFDNGPTGYGHDRVAAYWESFSPMHNISETTPPTIVFLGTEDNLIPVETAIEYQRLMEASGRRSDLHLYEGQPHGFFNYNRRQYYLKTLAETDRFLVSLGYLTTDSMLQTTPNEDGEGTP